MYVFRIKDVEFFKDPMHNTIIVDQAGTYHPYVPTGCRFSQALTREFIEGYLPEVRREAYEFLRKEYSESRPNKSFYEYRIVDRFIRCNLGSLDMKDKDIDAHGYLHFEEVYCPKRGKGECSGDGVCCRPKQTVLSHREVEVLEQISCGLDAYEIGKNLFISKLTVDNHRNHILGKTGARNVACAVNYYKEHLKV